MHYMKNKFLLHHHTHFYNNINDFFQSFGNTFQSIIVTNGSQTFLISLYSEINYVPTPPPSAESYGALNTDTRRNLWTPAFNGNISQAPLLMQNSNTPGMYVYDLNKNPPNPCIRRSCKDNIVELVCRALQLAGKNVLPCRNMNMATMAT